MSEELLDFDDIEEDGKIVTASNNQLAALSGLVDELVILIGRKAKGEELLKQVTSRISELETRDIPEAMHQARTLEHRSEGSGKLVSVKDIIKANMPSEKDENYEELHEKAIKWLDDNGMSGIVSRRIEVDFGKEDAEMAQRIFDLITQHTNGVFQPVMKQAVNFQTLNANLRAKKERGERMPADDGSDGLKVFNGRKASISTKKS